MRRPAMTREQKQHAREQRALLELRRAAVAFSVVTEAAEAGGYDYDALVDLEGACDRYRQVIGKRAVKRLMSGDGARARAVKSVLTILDTWERG